MDKKRKESPILEAIVQSAENLFHALGFEKTTTNKIAEKAGVSIGSLYQYFKNKEVIFSFVADRFLKDNREALLKILAESELLSLNEFIDRIVDQGVDRFVHKRAFLKILLNDINKMTTSEKLISARKQLALEMSQMLLEKFPNEVTEDQLQEKLFLGFNAYMGLMHSMCLNTDFEKDVELNTKLLKSQAAGLFRSFIFRKQQL